jgi:hypothetical protein
MIVGGEPAAIIPPISSFGEMLKRDICCPSRTICAQPEPEAFYKQAKGLMFK